MVLNLPSRDPLDGRSAGSSRVRGHEKPLTVEGMKLADVDRIYEGGLITAEQRQRIQDHFGLKQETNRFLVIIAFIGAVLVVSGIALVISANWQEIPRVVKIAGGVLLMAGFHSTAYYLSRIRKDYEATAQALHIGGALMFLANIALIGQIYNLSSRPPNAFLLWWLGIAPLPWLLRSKPQHILSLLAFGLWFGMELNDHTSRFFIGTSPCQVALYSALGLLYVGIGYCLRGTRYGHFAKATEGLGLTAFHVFLFPLPWKLFYHSGEVGAPSRYLFLALGVISSCLIARGLRDEPNLTRQWRWTWGVALVAGIGLLSVPLIVSREQLIVDGWQRSDLSFGYYAIVAIVWFVICLIQIQVGVQLRSGLKVNLGVACIALDIIAIYIDLVGSMARTGLMFVISGVFLIVFGLVLEKKRRSFLLRMKPSSTLTI